MDDEGIRRLERAWLETGDLAKGAAWLTESLRRGEVNEEELRVRAAMGDELARACLGPSRSTRYDGLPGFVERWFAEPLAPDYPAASARLVELETEHGPLSAALREWIILTWGRHWEGYNQNRILEPRRVSVSRDGHLALFVENQGNYSYTTQLVDQDQEDPRVWADRKVQAETTASEALVTGLIAETCMNGSEPEIFGGEGLLGELTAGVIGEAGFSRAPFAALGERYPLLPGALVPWNVTLAGAPEELRVYGDETLVIVGAGPPAGEIFVSGMVLEASRVDELHEALDLVD